MADVPPEVIDKVAGTLTEVAAGGLVTKWFVVMETIDGDTGQVQLEAMHPYETAIWDLLGMLEYEIAFIRRRIEVPPPD